MASYFRAVALSIASSLLFSSLSSAQQLTPFDDWAHGMIQLPTVKLHFRYAGSGPPLLLIHGNPQHSVSYQIYNCQWT